MNVVGNYLLVCMICNHRPSICSHRTSICNYRPNVCNHRSMVCNNRPWFPSFVYIYLLLIGGYFLLASCSSHLINRLSKLFFFFKYD